MNIDFEGLERILGYTFKNRELLLRAITHPSFAHEHPEFGSDNQRLEFLGDSIIGMVIAAWVFENRPDWDEGKLTALKSHFVKGHSLAAWAKRLEIHRFLLMGKGSEVERTKDGPLADAFEAIMAAIFIDGGIEPVKLILHGLLEEDVARIHSLDELKDPKSMLQEKVIKQKGITPVYKDTELKGGGYESVVLINGEVFGKGRGISKKEAQMAAAKEALSRV